MMGRIARRVAMLALLGAGTSVAVAWGLAAWLPNAGCYRTSSVHWRGFRPYADLEVREYERPGMRRRHWWTSGDNAPGFDLYVRWVVTDSTRERPWTCADWAGHRWGMLDRAKARDQRVPEEGFDDARGWPVACLWYGATDFPLGLIAGGALSAPGSPFRVAPPATVIHGGIALPPAAGHSGDAVRALPLMPIWRGLAINTAFYGVLWWAGISAVTGTRRWGRRRRGLCPRCAYDLKHGWDGGCPECGWGRGVGNASPAG